MKRRTYRALGAIHGLCRFGGAQIGKVPKDYDLALSGGKGLEGSNDVQAVIGPLIKTGGVKENGCPGGVRSLV